MTTTTGVGLGVQDSIGGSHAPPLLLTVETIDVVAAIILATKHMSSSNKNSNKVDKLQQQALSSWREEDRVSDLTAVMLDIDLSVLGGREHAQYEVYERQIRREYAHVPWVDYRAGRAKVLNHFLQQARAGELYNTSFFTSLVLPNGLNWHQNAEANILWALDNLQNMSGEKESEEEEEDPFSEMSSNEAAATVELSTKDDDEDEDEDIQSLLL